MIDKRASSVYRVELRALPTDSWLGRISWMFRLLLSAETSIDRIAGQRILVINKTDESVVAEVSVPSTVAEDRLTQLASALTSCSVKEFERMIGLV